MRLTRAELLETPLATLERWLELIRREYAAMAGGEGDGGKPEPQKVRITFADLNRMVQEME